MEEIRFPEELGEDQLTLSGFCQEVLHRMRTDHPELLERHLSNIVNIDPYHRAFSARSLKVIMDVIDIRATTKAIKDQHPEIFGPHENKRLA